MATGKFRKPEEAPPQETPPAPSQPDAGRFRSTNENRLDPRFFRSPQQAPGSRQWRATPLGYAGQQDLRRPSVRRGQPEIPYVSYDQAIDNLPNSELLTPSERWLYKKLPLVMNKTVAGRPVGDWLESFNDGPFGKVLGILDIGAETLERGHGFLSQWSDAYLYGNEDTRQEFDQNLSEAWYAGSLFADMSNLPGYARDENGKVSSITIPGHLGGRDAINRARQRIAELVDNGMVPGEALKQVRAEYYTDLGALSIRAQMQDSYYHMLLDPLQVLMPVLKPVERAQAARTIATTQRLIPGTVDTLTDTANALQDAARIAENAGDVAQAAENTAAAARILERAEVLKGAKELGSLDKFALFMTGGDPLEPTRLASKWNPFSLTPSARANEMMTAIGNNIDNYILAGGDDPFQIMETIARANKGSLGPEYGHAFLTLEGRTAQSTVNAAEAAGKKLLADYVAVEPQMELIEQAARLTGETVYDVVHHIEGDDAAAFIKRVSSMGDEGAELALQMNDDFVGVVSDFNRLDMPYTTDLYKWRLSEELRDASMQMAISKFGLGERGLIQKMAGTVKTAETLAFLRINPTFVAKNFINNEATILGRGLGGLVTNSDLARFIDDLGFKPARLRQAFTMAGEGFGEAKTGVQAVGRTFEDVVSETGKAEKRLAEVLRGDGFWTKLDDTIRQGGDKLPKWIDMGHMATRAERSASARAFYTGYSQAWNRYFWKPGKGYARMSDAVRPEIFDTIPRNISNSIEQAVGAVNSEDGLRAITNADNLNLNARAIAQDIVQDYGYDLHNRFDAAYIDKLTENLSEAMPKGVPAVRRTITNARKEMAAKLDNMAEAVHQQRIDEIAAITQMEGPGAFTRIWGDAIDDFHGGSIAYDANMARFVPEGLTGKAADIFWTQKKAEQGAYWTRQWNRLDEVIEGMNKGAKNLLDTNGKPLKIPAEVTGGFKGWRKGWDDFYNFRNKLQDKFFKDLLDGETPSKAWVEIQDEINTAYLKAVGDEAAYTTGIDDAMTGMVRQSRPEVADAFAAWRQRARELRLSDREDLVAFRQSLVGQSQDYKTAAWKDFWQGRQEPHLKLWRTDRAALAALQGNDQALAGLTKLDEFSGASKAVDVRTIANRYGIPSVTNEGVPLDRRLVDTVNKHLRGGYDEVGDASKIVDDSGDLMTVYHGTYQEFDKFDLGKAGQHDPGFFGEGFYFYPDEKRARSFASDFADNIDDVSVRQQKLDIRNPYEVNIKGDAEFPPGMKETLNREELISQGYDGVVVRRDGKIDEIVAFEPDQILDAAGEGTPGAQKFSELTEQFRLKVDEFVTTPRDEIDPVVSRAMEDQATEMLSELRAGKAGQKFYDTSQTGETLKAGDELIGKFKDPNQALKQGGAGFKGYEPSTNPLWYGEIADDHSRKAIIRALEKIIEDDGVDKGVAVERLKQAGLAELVETDPRIMRAVGREDQAFQVMYDALQSGQIDDLANQLGGDMDAMFEWFEQMYPQLTDDAGQFRPREIDFTQDPIPGLTGEAAPEPVRYSHLSDIPPEVAEEAFEARRVFRGDPKRIEVLHGSPTEGLTEIAPSGGDWGRGVYVTPDEATALGYSQGRQNVAAYVLGDTDVSPPTGTVYKLDYETKNPLVISNQEEWTRIERLATEGKTGLETKLMGEWAKEQGYDAILDDVTGEYIIFTDDAIKVKSVVDDAPQQFDGLMVDSDQAMKEANAMNAPLAVGEDQHWLANGFQGLDDIEAKAIKRIEQPPLKLGDLSAEQTAEVEKYLRGVEGQLADARMASMKFGEFRRDSALLNYNRRYNYNDWLGTIMPFEFWTTQSLAKWALHSIDRPAMLSTFLRMRKFLATAGLPENGFPSRLQDSVRINMPFLPPWMNKSVWVDPLRWALPFDNWISAYEQYRRDSAGKNGRAERLLLQQVADGQLTQAEAQQAIADQSGTLWDNAVNQAEVNDDEGKTDAFDYASLLLSPHAPINWAREVARGTPENIGAFLPISRTIKQAFGVLGVDTSQSKYNVAGNIRKMMGLPAFDKWDDYRIDRELSNMAAEGYPLDAIQRAMIERDGALWDEATTRSAKMFAGGNVLTFLMKTLGIPVQGYPEGEGRQRGLQDDFSKAYEAYDNGDVQALTDFFDQYPEYETRLALWDEPEERLRKFMVDNIWDTYHELPTVHKRELQAYLGDDWQHFMSVDTKGSTFTAETLQSWLKIMGGDPPGTLNSEAQPLEFADQATSWQVEQFYNLRGAMFPQYRALQNEYFALSDDAKSDFRYANPELTKYWDWRRDFFHRNPNTVPYLDDDFEFEYPSSAAYQAAQTGIPTYTFQEWSYVLGSRSTANVLLSGDIPLGTEGYLEDQAAELGLTLDEMIDLVGQAQK